MAQLKPRLSTPTQRRKLAPLLAASLSVLVLAVLVLAISRFRGHGGSKTSGSQPSAAGTQFPPRSSPITGPSASSARDFEAVYKEIEAIRAKAFDNYRPELLEGIYSPDCKGGCNIDREKQVIQEMATAQARYDHFAPSVLLVEVLSESSAILEGKVTRTVTLRVVTKQDDYSIVDPSGRVLEPGKGWPPESSLYDIYYSSSKGRWVIVNSAFEGSGDRFLKSSPNPAPSSRR